MIIQLYFMAFFYFDNRFKNYKNHKKHKKYYCIIISCIK